MHDNSATSAQCTAFEFTNAFSLPILYLLSLALSVPDPLLAVEFAAAGTAQELREVPERHREPGHAKVCVQPTRALAFWYRQPHHHTVPLAAAVLLHIWSHPYNLQCSSATLSSRYNLKVSWVPKSSTHWYQWFRGSAMLSKRNIFASFINHSKPLCTHSHNAFHSPWKLSLHSSTPSSILIWQRLPWTSFVWNRMKYTTSTAIFYVISESRKHRWKIFIYNGTGCRDLYRKGK